MGLFFPYYQELEKSLSAKKEELFQHKNDLDDEQRVMDKEVVEVKTSQKGEESASSHCKVIIRASSSGLTSSIRSQDSRIVRVPRAFRGKDRHSKVFTIKGLRDRRVRLSVPTAIQLYDLQDRLGLSQPSKVVDWLLDAAKHEIDQLPPLPLVPGTNFVHSIHHPRLSAASHHLQLNLDGLVRASDDWTTSGSASERNLREATQEPDDECRHHEARKGSRGKRQERDGHDSGCPLGSSNDMPKWPRPYNGISQEVFRLAAGVPTQHVFAHSISAALWEDEIRQSMINSFANEIREYHFRR